MYTSKVRNHATRSTELLSLSPQRQRQSVVSNHEVDVCTHSIICHRVLLVQPQRPVCPYSRLHLDGHHCENIIGGRGDVARSVPSVLLLVDNLTDWSDSTEQLATMRRPLAASAHPNTYRRETILHLFHVFINVFKVSHRQPEVSLLLKTNHCGRPADCSQAQPHT